MAKKMMTIMTDDLDGVDLAEGEGETVNFAIDGVEYEIDISTDNADALRGLMRDYIEAGRKVRGATRGTAGRKAAPSGPSAAEVRAWALENGYEVPARGRIPSDVREAYDAA